MIHAKVSKTAQNSSAGSNGVRAKTRTETKTKTEDKDKNKDKHRHTDTNTQTHKHRHTDTNTQTHADRHRQTDHRHRQTQTQTDTDRHRQTDRQTDRQRNRYQRQRDQQTKRDRDRHRQRDRDKKRLFCNSGTNIFYHLICINKCKLVACEKHAAVPQAKTRSTRKYPGCKQSRTDFAQNTKESVKGGRLSKVRTDPRAVGLKRSIHTRSCCKRKRKRDRPENILGASKAGLISPKALRKNTTGRKQSAAAHSFSHRQTLGKLIRTGRYMPRKRIRRQICWRTPPLNFQ